jgi:ABC-2 type transport system permease protein
MNTPSNAMPESLADAKVAAPAVGLQTRPFYWSVRRELWEHRSIYIAPLAGAGVALLGFMFVLARLPHTVRNTMTLDRAGHADVLVRPYDYAAGLVMLAAFLVSIFYALDALYGERRDRSILFWKSLPVSDLTAVLAKATIPLLVLPLLAFAITAVTQFIMLLLSSVVLLASGLSVGTYWAQVQVFERLLMLLYHLVTAHMLWYAPLYAWLLLISAWARRAPFLWAALPPLAIHIFEKIAFHTDYFTQFLKYRFDGGQDAAASMQGDFPLDPSMHLTPGAFLANPGLWFGLLFAALFLFAAARLRRSREPT